MKTILIILLFLIANHIAAAQNFDNLMQEAGNLMLQQDYKNAADVLEQAQKIEPKNEYVLYNISICYLNIGRLDLANVNIQEFIKLKKSSPEAYNLQGFVYENMTKLDSAISNYNKAIKLSQNFYEAYLGRGRTYFKQEKYTLAKKDLLVAKKGMPKNSQVYNILGQICYHTGEIDEAIKYLEIASKEIKDDLALLQTLANSYYFTKNYDKAVENYSKVLKIAPEDLNALNNRMLCYNELEMAEESEADMEAIKVVKEKSSVQINSLQYKTISSADEYITFDIPEGWRAFAQEGKDTATILFFNPAYDNVVSDYSLNYGFGGEFVLIKNIFPEITDAMQRRDTIESYHLRTQAEQTANYASYKVYLKKMLNPNAKYKQGIVSVTYQKTEADEERFGIEYYAVTTSGNLIKLNLWVPASEAVRYEKVLEYLAYSLKINEPEQ